MKDHLITIGIIVLGVIWIWSMSATEGLTLFIPLVGLLVFGLYTMVLELVRLARRKGDW